MSFETCKLQIVFISRNCAVQFWPHWGTGHKSFVRLNWDQRGRGKTKLDPGSTHFNGDIKEISWNIIMVSWDNPLQGNPNSVLYKSYCFYFWGSNWVSAILTKTSMTGSFFIILHHSSSFFMKPKSFLTSVLLEMCPMLAFGSWNPSKSAEKIKNPVMFIWVDHIESYVLRGESWVMCSFCKRTVTYRKPDIQHI